MKFEKKLTKEEALELAEEISKFCPDVIEQGSGTVENYAEEILEENTIFLWWD